MNGVSLLSRRAALSMLGLSTGALVYAQPAAGAPKPAPQGRLDLTRPEDNVRAIVKLTGDTAGATTYSFSLGHVFAPALDTVATPIVNFRAARQSKFRDLGGGVFDFRFVGVILYTDPVTGEVVDELVNPFTRARVRVKHWRSSIGHYYYTPQGARAPAQFEGTAGAAGGEAGRPYLLPWVRVADELFVTLDERVRYKRPSDGAWIIDNALLRHHGPAEAVLSADTTSAPSTSSWQTAISWFPWLEMPNPGQLLMQGGHGRKISALTEFPPDSLRDMERVFPGALTAPIRWP